MLCFPQRCQFNKCVVFLGPSFDSQTTLQQVGSNASTNTITVSIPQIDDSDGPIRYSLYTVFM